MKILIYGFGRMGLTHYAILNSLVKNAVFTFVDPNKILNLICNRNVKGTFLESDKNISSGFDLTLITTPPFIHEEIVNNCLKRGDKNIFVEKPFGGHSNFNFSAKFSNVYVGYVLRFNPIVKWIKTNINPDEIIEVKSQYLSNTIENKPRGWRNGSYSGVLNEMGSHIIDLNNYLFKINEYEIINKDIKSHISDVDDEVKFCIHSKNRKFNFYFNWVNKLIRKPTFSFELKLTDGREILFDQQKIIINKDGIKNNISVVELNQNIPYYLRGVDFTGQMKDLINQKQILCTIKDAMTTNNLMKKILQK